MNDRGTIYIDAQKAHRKRVLAIIIAGITFVFLIYICSRASYIVENDPSTGIFVAIISSIINLGSDPFKIYLGGKFLSILGITLVITAFIIWCAYDHRLTNSHYKDGEQYGSARMQTVESIRAFNRKYNSPYGKDYASGTENTILSKHCFLGTDTKATKMNNNIICVGGPGSGKSHRIVKPNLLQADNSTSYVITDPSGELLEQTGNRFEELGYTIKVFNLVDMIHSHRYNPLMYIRQESDVLTLIEGLISNTDGDCRSSDPFWPKAERALLEAIIFYMLKVYPPEKQTFYNAAELIRCAKINPNEEMSELDRKMEAVRESNPENICLKQYDTFKLANIRTAQSILISAAIRLDPFNIRQVNNLTRADDLDLSSIGDKPTALFIITPQGDSAYDFLVNMLYTQMWDTLYYHALHDNNDVRLPCDIRFILDEFANIGIIPDFLKKLTTMRKYGMSCMIFIQAVSQLKELYRNNWETIMGACDTQVYLGGNETSSMKDLNEKLGDQTIRVRDRSSSKSGSRGTDSKSFKYTGRNLLKIDEIRRLRPGYGIIIIKGQQPFYDELYDPFEHENASSLGNPSTKENCFFFTYTNEDSGTDSVGNFKSNNSCPRTAAKPCLEMTVTVENNAASSTPVSKGISNLDEASGMELLDLFNDAFAR